MWVIFSRNRIIILWGYATKTIHTGDEDEGTALMEGVTLLW